MSEEWFDVAYINFDEAILHGRMTDGMDEFHVRKEREVRVVLNDAQKRLIEDMNTRHQMQMQRLLRSFAA
jgi:NADH dehydrogenase FAD-containing subunit